MAWQVAQIFLNLIGPQNKDFKDFQLLNQKGKNEC